MTASKRHLAKTRRHPACGMPGARLFTRDPAEVTCRACQRTLYMADAEIRRASRTDRKRERRQDQ